MYSDIELKFMVDIMVYENQDINRMFNKLSADKKEIYLKLVKQGSIIEFSNDDFKYFNLGKEALCESFIYANKNEYIEFAKGLQDKPYKEDYPWFFLLKFNELNEQNPLLDLEYLCQRAETEDLADYLER